ncbi:AbgT family transporter [Glaciimonas sp. GG7]
MSALTTPKKIAPSQDKRWVTRFLNTVETLGNLLPHPITLFVLLSAAVLLSSAVAAYFGVQVPDPRPPGVAGRADDGMITVVNLLSATGLAKIVTHLVSNFTNFVPLGTVLVAMLGVGVAEHSGLLSAALRGVVIGAPRRLVTPAIVFAGIMSNTAGELGYVVLIPLAAMIFYSLGRHPLAGLAAAFAGVSGGYSANLALGTIDPLLAGITQTAARLIDVDYVVGAEMNWYFMAVSTALITVLGALITEKIVEPKLGIFIPPEDFTAGDEATTGKLTAMEKKGLVAAGAAVLFCTGLLLWAVLPEGAPLRNAKTGLIAHSPFLNGIVAFIFVFFLIPGFVYGRVVGSMKNDKDIINAMAKSMSGMGLYIVLVFFAAQFVAFFGWTHFGSVIAVKGATALQESGLTGPAMFFFFIAMCAFINLMIGSSSAQWAITAPIFVPMLMLIGYAPEMVQAAYRIGDSVTNLITPMMSYFGLIVAMASRYQKNLGLGTLIAMMLPYSMIFALCWSVFFYLWVFVFNIPVGPGAATYYSLASS